MTIDKAMDAPAINSVTLSVPGSKSLTNRALLLSALAGGQTLLKGILLADDTTTMITCLTQLGISIDVDTNALTALVSGRSGSFSRCDETLYCHDSGTVLRFLVPACAGVGGCFHFSGSSQLTGRPLKPLLCLLEKLGCAFIFEKQPYCLPFQLKSPGFSAATINIISGECSQYVSGLLMAAPLAKGAITICDQGCNRKPYINMTTAMMKQFGVTVQQDQDRYHFVPTQYKSPGDFMIEPDASTASYFWALAALFCCTVKITGFTPTSTQGDMQFLSCLAKMGCQVNHHAHTISVTGGDARQGITVNMQDYSDTFMTLAALAPFAQSVTTITHIGHARLHESDRILAMQDNLERLKVNVESGPDWLRIWPSTIVPNKLMCYNDHRIAMSLAIIAAKVNGIELVGAQCVSKTCPAYFQLLQQVVSHV